MILAKCGGAALAVALALTANVAQADVLEIGDDGARWIAGDQAVLLEPGVSDAGMPDAGAQELSAEWGGDLPPAALSDPAAQAGGIPQRTVRKPIPSRRDLLFVKIAFQR